MDKPTFLLINPYIYDFTAYDLWLKPLGLLYLAAILEENGGNVILLDALDRWHPEVLKMDHRSTPNSRQYGIGSFHKEHVAKPSIFRNIKRYFSCYGMPPHIFQGELQKIKANHKVDMILVTSSMTYWYLGVHEIITSCKNYFPGIPVLLGGVYATLCYDHARRLSGADWVCQGEGEIQILEKIAQFLGISPKKVHSGYDDYPFPAYHLYPKLEYVAMLTSRGCPYTCSFCASRQLVPHHMRRRPSKVVEEIALYVCEHKIPNITFYDDALFIDAEHHIKPILREVILRGLHTNFHTPNGLFPRLLDEELAQLMAQSGFKSIRLSYESKDPKRQQQMGKVRDCDLEKALVNIEKVGYVRRDVTVYLMMGLPHQSRREAEEGIGYVNGLGARVSISPFSPIPHTPDWESAVRDFGFPGDEPLYANKSIYPLQTDDFTLQDFEELKMMAFDLNEKLMK